MISRDFDVNYGQYDYGDSSSTDIEIRMICDCTNDYGYD